jgi:hypothetical protein
MIGRFVFCEQIVAFDIYYREYDGRKHSSLLLLPMNQIYKFALGDVVFVLLRLKINCRKFQICFLRLYFALMFENIMGGNILAHSYFV